MLTWASSSCRPDKLASLQACASGDEAGAPPPMQYTSKPAQHMCTSTDKQQPRQDQGALNPGWTNHNSPQLHHQQVSRKAAAGEGQRSSRCLTCVHGCQLPHQMLSCVNV